MIQTKCIQKFRNKQGKIYGYRLQDINGQTQDVTPEDLKKAMHNKQIDVINLTLTSDGRLVDKKAEKQLENKKIMPNKVEKPVDINDKLIKLIEQCANRIAQSINKRDAQFIDCDSSLKGYVQATFDIGGVVYKGTERQLDIRIDFTDNKGMWIGLIDMDEFCTEAEKHLKINDKSKFNIQTAIQFTDKYIDYIKKLNNKKYKAMFKSLMWLEELDEDVEKITRNYDSTVKVIEIPNNVSINNMLEGEYRVGAYSLDDYLYPYMYTDYVPHTVEDCEENFVIAFIKDGYSESTLFYSTNKERCLSTFGEHFKINNSRCDECMYSEKIIGMHSNEYTGFVADIQPMQKIETIIQKRRDTILIKVNKLGSTDTEDSIDYNEEASEEAVASIFSSYNKPNSVEVQKSKLNKFEDLCEKVVDKINNELHSNVCISDIDEKTFTCYCMGKVEFKYPEAVILDAVIEKNSMIMYLEGYDENGLLDGGRANEINIQELTKDNIELAIETYKKLKHSQTISYKDKIKISNGKIIK